MSHHSPPPTRPTNFIMFMLMISRCFMVLSTVLMPSFITTGCVSVSNEQKLNELGLHYHFRHISSPRPNRVHVLRVNLANKNIQPAVVIAKDPDGNGPAEAALTHPFKLARDSATLAFINTNPWDSFPDVTGKKNRDWFAGQPVDIDGLAISSGKVRSHSQPRASSVWFNNIGHVILGNKPDNKNIEKAVNGFQPIVREGTVVVSPDEARHPRTAIGTDRGGILMWLVVVDGRQEGYSEGMNLHELGSLMVDLGCWHATNMDGGGSSIMGLAGADGNLRTVNSPSDRVLGFKKIRPLPMILTIVEKSKAEAAR